MDQMAKGKNIVFTTIERKDREWINRTKTPGQKREDRLHEVITLYRQTVLGEKI